jgi:hypothetical protein
MDAQQLDRVAILSAHIKMLGEITFAVVGRSSEDWGPEAVVQDPAKTGIRALRSS